MKAVKIIMFVLTPIGIVLGLFNIGYGFFISPFNQGYVALGFIFLLVNGFGLVVALSDPNQ